MELCPLAARTRALERTDEKHDDGANGIDPYSEILGLGFSGDVGLREKNLWLVCDTSLSPIAI
jgi:hypothetical protein